MPSEPSVHTGCFRSLPSLIRRPALLRVYLIIIFGLAASYTTHSYISPLMQNLGCATDAGAALLLVLGIAGILGNVLGTKNIERHPIASIILPLAGLTIGLSLLFPVTGTIAGTLIICLIWGVALGALSFSVNCEVIRQAPDATDVAASLSNVSFNIGIAGGSFLGGMVYAGLGIDLIGLAGAGVAGLILVAAAVSMFAG